MLKMLKWSVIGLVVLAGGAWLVFGSHAGSYLHTAAREIRQGVHDQIPVEFELKRAEALIHEIEPQLHTARRELAQAEVDLARLQDDVEHLEGEVQRGEQQLRHVSATLRGNGEARYTLAGMERSRLQLQLERTFDTHQNNVALLEGKRALIERQQRAVEAARQRVEAVRIEKARLEDMVATLRTQKRNLDAMAASARTFEFDDSPLGQAREVLDDIKNRLDVAQKMLEDDLLFAGEPVGAPNRDILSEVDAFFGSAAPGGRTETVEIR
ncbi:MAG: hypothetical protein IPM29_18785 [Planctomycetes bacterium]|nr:hypothetical protein [Planctomycetota bacterium]